MESFTPVAALLGGSLIGLSASLFLLTHGRIAGISSLYGGLWRRAARDRPPSFAFVLGLLLSGLAVRILYPGALGAPSAGATPWALLAGVLVGVGTQLGNGCTSGHGVCGVSRLSVRSIVATVTFMATGFATTYLVRHVLGVGR